MGFLIDFSKLVIYLAGLAFVFHWFMALVPRFVLDFEDIKKVEVVNSDEFYRK